VLSQMFLFIPFVHLGGFQFMSFINSLRVGLTRMATRAPTSLAVRAFMTQVQPTPEQETRFKKLLYHSQQRGTYYPLATLPLSCLHPPSQAQWF